MKFMNSVFVKDTSVLGFDTANTIAPVNAGEMSWNQADGTLDLRLYNGVTLQAGQELHVYGKASGTVSEGTVVMFAGAQGDHILISAANGSTLRQNPHYIVGIATQTILNGEFGYVTWFGKVHELNTNGWAPGTVLYYDATLNALSATMPTAPDPKVIMAAVLRQHTQEGSILVRPDFGKSLSGLNDVQVSDIQDGQVIAWNSTNGRWENTTIEAGGGASTAADVTIADLSGYFTATEVESALAELHQQDLFPSDDSIVWQENQSLDVVVATDAVLGDPIPYNADTLDFHSASYFATATDLAAVESNLVDGMNYKGDVALYAGLPLTPSKGDMYRVVENTTTYVWSGTEWVAVGGGAMTAENVVISDADAYYTSENVEGALAELGLNRIIFDNGIPSNPIPVENTAPQSIKLFTQTISSDYTIPEGNNAVSVGPISIADGVTVTIADGSRWIIL